VVKNDPFNMLMLQVRAT